MEFIGDLEQNSENNYSKSLIGAEGSSNYSEI